MYALMRTRLFAMISLCSLIAMVGCGGSGSITGQGPGLGNGSNNAMLQGQYAFALSGQDSNGPFLVVGSFAADGQGHIGGNEDVNSSSLQSRGTVHFAGTYAVGSDGRGNAVLGIQPGCPNWQFTMLNHAHALLTCLNTNITGSGTIDLQDTTAFSTSALKGNYVFGFSGVGTSGGLVVMAGDWSTDGAGNITSGQADINDSFSVSQAAALTGSYSVSSNGRGTATISSSYATQNFVFYVVNATDIKFMEADQSVPVVSGEVLSQASGPFRAGTYAFTLGGVDVNGSPLALGGLLPADANGNITSGTLDFNDNTSVSLGGTVSGTYGITAGREVATVNGSNLPFSVPLAFYTASNGILELVNVGGSLVVSGMAKAQSGGPFGNQSMNGNYAVNFSGTNVGGTVAVEEDISGQLNGNAAGSLAGVLDINNSGSIFQGLPLSASTYTMAANGRGTASMNAGSSTFDMQTYQIDANTILFLDADSNRVMTGIAEKQQF